MSRRRFLALAGGLAVPPAIATAGTVATPQAVVSGPPPPRVEWRDVTLLDGSHVRADWLRNAPVVVEFWASWCPFCARQNPQLQALWDAQRANGLRVLTFSIDRDPGAARRYVADHRYTFPAALQSAQSARSFGPRRGLPMLYVVDPAGRIVVEEAGEMFAEDVAALARYAPAPAARDTSRS